MIPERCMKASDWRGTALALAGLLLVVGSGCTTTASAPPMRSEAVAPYRVGAPDELTVIILPDPQIDRTVVVRPDGMITIDLIGDVRAGGRTVEEIARDVQAV